MTPITVHPEGPRYARGLVFIPGLWTPAEAFRPLASFLAHRGWAGVIADTGGLGGVEARAVEIAGLVQTLAAPPVVVGHDAGGLVALALAARTPVSGVAWLAPFGPRPRRLTRDLGIWRLAAAMLRRRDLGPPTGAGARALFGDDAPSGLLVREAIALVRDVLRSGPPGPLGRMPVAVLATPCDVLARDAVLPGAERLTVEAPGRALFGAAAWRVTADVLHRWLVQRLGAPNLELYEEAMAERDASEEP